ncbi:MAG: TIGR01459 family HAD-type hydrolase [Rhodobacteraceae bacterium]|nr:TIGR01459 family HAD-type hydrolase [Paracoccaceae bacterium]
MTSIIQSLDEIASGYDALFCDLWGCLHNGVAPFPEAVAALERFAARGGHVILLTNSPRPRDSVARQLDRMGTPRHIWHDIASSGDAAQAGMFAGVVGEAVHHIGPPRDESFFADIPADLPERRDIRRVTLGEADGIVCTGLFDDMTETPADYRATLLHAKVRGLKLLCANPDIVVDVADKRIFCAGALAAAYEEMGGESLYFGKPHAPIYDLARRRLAAVAGAPVPDARILCLGDGLRTDVQGALAEDLDCLFITGGIAAEETGTAPGRGPDPARLAAHLDEAQVSVDYAMGFLR